VIHSVAVTSFIAAGAALAAGVATMRWVVAGVSALTLTVAFFVQGIGRGREVIPAILTDAATRKFITVLRLRYTLANLGGRSISEEGVSSGR
jgi:hypothetical protein